MNCHNQLLSEDIYKRILEQDLNYITGNNNKLIQKIIQQTLC